MKLANNSFSNFLKSAYHLYYDGFRSMTLGKTLWTVILIKLFIIFGVLKLVFFPDFLKQRTTEGKEAEYVSEEIINRSK